MNGCEKCGKLDSSLRLTSYQRVWSFVVFSRKVYDSGVWCDQCRNPKRWSNIGLSLLFGPWGFPWGIIWTIESILKNVTGGEQLDVENSRLLDAIGFQLLNSNEVAEGLRALEESYKLVNDQEILDMINSVKRLHSSTKMVSE